VSFLLLTLYKHPSGAILDPELVIRALRAYFPEAEVLPGDQLAAEADRAEAFLADRFRANPEAPARRVVASLRRKAETYGPAYAFRIARPGGSPIRGTARRYDLIFLFDEPLSPEFRQRVLTFLKSFGVGRLEDATSEKPQSEVLCDMPGPRAGEEHVGPAVIMPHCQNRDTGAA
jgi:hypothetical protein